MDNSASWQLQIVDYRFGSWTGQCIVRPWERHFTPMLLQRGQTIYLPWWPSQTKDCMIYQASSWYGKQTTHVGVGDRPEVYNIGYIQRITMNFKSVCDKKERIQRINTHCTLTIKLSWSSFHSWSIFPAAFHNFFFDVCVVIPLLFCWYSIW